MKSEYWIYCLISKNNDIREAYIGKDGLLIKAKLYSIKDLLSRRPNDDNKVWYFNETKDRKIATLENDNEVVANPQLIWQAGFEITN